MEGLIRPRAVFLAQLKAWLHNLRTGHQIVTYSNVRRLKYVHIPVLIEYVLIETEDGVVFYQGNAEEAKQMREWFQVHRAIIKAVSGEK